MPALMPVTKPPASMVAMVGESILQVPPDGVAVTREVAPTHSGPVPKMADGAAITVTACVDWQPELV